MNTRYGLVAAICAVLTGSLGAAQQTETPGNSVAASVSEQVVTRRATTGGASEVIREVYGKSSREGRLALSQRVRSVTTATNDGTRTVEEVEVRDPATESDRLRLVERRVTTVRRIEAGWTTTERQYFERDVNGRFVLVRTETERSSDY